jgi:hypothetical protein
MKVRREKEVKANPAWTRVERDRPIHTSGQQQLDARGGHAQEMSECIVACTAHAAEVVVMSA